eukprot:GHVS01088813.1.p2 GENE.GHVS01088813.1~~GHVS01088813.1.p2  ORF type:complete len:168 (-),score=45.00 GHVS01088813.1:45-548(-)
MYIYMCIMYIKRTKQQTYKEPNSRHTKNQTADIQRTKQQTQQTKNKTADRQRSKQEADKEANKETNKQLTKSSAFSSSLVPSIGSPPAPRIRPRPWPSPPLSAPSCPAAPLCPSFRHIRPGPHSAVDLPGSPECPRLLFAAGEGAARSGTFLSTEGRPRQTPRRSLL